MDFCGGKIRGGACEDSASVFPKIGKETRVSAFLTWKEEDQFNYCFHCIKALAEEQNKFLSIVLECFKEMDPKERAFSTISEDEIPVLQLTLDDPLLLKDIDTSLVDFISPYFNSFENGIPQIDWQKVQYQVMLFQRISF